VTRDCHGTGELYRSFAIGLVGKKEECRS